MTKQEALKILHEHHAAQDEDFILACAEAVIRERKAEEHNEKARRHWHTVATHEEGSAGE